MSDDHIVVGTRVTRSFDGRDSSGRTGVVVLRDARAVEVDQGQWREGYRIVQWDDGGKPEWWMVGALDRLPTDAGRKDDSIKPRWSLIPAGTIAQVVAVLEHGAARYDVDNWQRVEGARTRYYDAMQRHVDAWRNGEIHDNGPDGSGLPHLAHAVCCCLFLLWFDAHGEVAK